MSAQQRTIIYTPAAQKKLAEVQDDYRRGLERIIRTGRYVPGEDLIEVTASDVERARRQLRIARRDSLWSEPWSVVCANLLVCASLLGGIGLAAAWGFVGGGKTFLIPAITVGIAMMGALYVLIIPRFSYLRRSRRSEMEAYEVKYEARPRNHKTEMDQTLSHLNQLLTATQAEKKAYQLFSEGVDCYAHGSKDAAMRKFIAAIELNPDLAPGHCNLGVVLGEQGKCDEAVAEYRRAIEIDPNHTRAHQGLGVMLARQGQYEEAVAEYRRAIEIDPKLAEAHCNLGVELARQGQYEEAVAEYSRAIEIDPKLAEAHSNLGVELARQGPNDEAEAEYGRAIKIDPNYATAHFNLACLHAAQGNAAAAVASLKAAIDLDQQYRAEAKTDPDFDTIGDDPEFRKLVYGD